MDTRMHGCFRAAAVLGALALTFTAVHAAQEDIRPGLAWVFFHDPAFDRPDGFGVDPRLDHDTGTTIQGYARIWLGGITAPVAGPVTFIAEADDGLRLQVGGRMVIDGLAPDGPRTGDYTFAAEGERAPLRVEFVQNGGEAHLRLFWEWPGRARERVPDEAFHHTAEDVRRLEETYVNAMSAEKTPVDRAHARLFRPGMYAPVSDPMPLGPGPHLFIDDYLIATGEGIERVVNTPSRDPGIPNPLINGKEDRCFQPYMTVLRDGDSGRFRIWYGAFATEGNESRSRIGYMESDDGIRWERPARILDDPGPITFGTSVVDNGPDHPDPARRFVFAWWHIDGLRLATSPDGFAWTPILPRTIIRHNHDICGIFLDAARGRYLATLSVYRDGDTWQGARRITMQSESADLLTWSPPHYIVLPYPDIDPGETQFYAMDGYLARGDMLVGMVKVLRDDLKADDPPDPPDAYGVGYTALAWSRDGDTWVRDPAHFFDPDPRQGAWDHAHAWIDEQVLVDDEVYLYYGGYARGHKVNRFEERQIGLLRIPRDRYAGYRAEGRGRIVTPPLRIDAARLALNVDAAGGRVRARLVAPDGSPVPGFDFDDAPPLTGDAVEAAVAWGRPLSELEGGVVRIELEMDNATVFAFYLGR